MQDGRAALEKMLVDLQRAKAGARADIVDALSALAYDEPHLRPELTSLLPELLSDADHEVRRSALELAAHTLPPAEAFPLLARGLADAAPIVRLEAAGRLADQGRPEVRAPLAAALRDDVFEVRFEAARGMATLHHSAGLDVLVEALRSNRLRFRALGALAELGDVRALPAVQRVFRRLFLSGFERTQAAGALARLGDLDGARHLLAKTRRTRAADRALAIELCGEVKAPGAYERLCEIVRDGKDKARGAAARGLGRFGDPRALGLLLPLLQDTALEEDLRLDAAEGIFHLRLPESGRTLSEVLPSFTTPDAQAELRAMLNELEVVP